ncbi:MAG TPA: aminotransferase class V-fold PLP-dependent enzyme [Burkholderiaceae bacterium]
MAHDIYLDGNATSPVLATALSAAMHAMEQDFGNPSSTHRAGLRAKALLETVRAKAARALGAGDGRLMFNSGATEGIHTAVLSALVAMRERRAGGQRIGRWLLYGATEHKAVQESLAHWNRLLGLDLEIVALPVDTHGRHDLARLRALAPECALVCTMAANNETGVISDLAGIQAVLDATGSPACWLVDCVQALGKLPLNLAATRIDYAPFSGHKLYAPKGIGMLYVREGAPFTPLLVGGGQEAGWRSGTENMAGIAALGAVLDLLQHGADGGTEGTTDGGRTLRDPLALAALRDRLADALRAAFPGLQFNTPFELALPTTLNFSVPGVASAELLDVFDAAGLHVSAGSACSSGRGTPSPVLKAMGLPAWRSTSAIRMSFGPLVSEATIAAACDAIARCGAMLAARPAAPDRSIADIAALEAFLQSHPDAMLVDVRDADELRASGGLRVGGRSALNVPMARLSEHAGAWLQANETPLVFVCRSGQRARRAAAAMRDQGHAQAWHLAGGLDVKLVVEAFDLAAGPVGEHQPAGVGSA